MQVHTETEEGYSATVFDNLVAAVQWGTGPVAVDILNDRITNRSQAERMIAALTAALPVLK